MSEAGRESSLGRRLRSDGGHWRKHATARWHVFDHQGIGADTCSVAYGDWPHDHRSRSDLNVIADHGRLIGLVVTARAHSDVVTQHAIVGGVRSSV